VDQAANQLALAVAILPGVPGEVEAYRSTGPATVLQLYDTTEDRLLAVVPRGDVHQDSALVIPVRNEERGGYDVACHVVEMYYESGSHSRAELEVTSVSRLKPFRAVARAHLSQLALVAVVAGAELSHGIEFDARLADISQTGFALLTERHLERGDLITMTTQLDTAVLRVKARCVQVALAPYGRRRIGCQIIDADSSSSLQLSRFLERQPTEPADRRSADRGSKAA
jgi:hypothetical protein